ncbi:MAG: T9SS type A sorting domain-containing protein [Bacteroidales bacterium]|nr:T9SS type A sorting domain-containing protein [Bacteroidales bacterium]
MKRLILLVSIVACMAFAQAQTISLAVFFNTSTGGMLDTLSLTTNSDLPSQGGYTLSQVGLSTLKVGIIIENNTGSDILAGDSIKIEMAYNNQAIVTRTLTLQAPLEADSVTALTLDEYILIGGLTQLGYNDICYSVIQHNESPVNDQGSCVVLEMKSSVSIVENELAAANIYPNPANNVLNISDVENADINIYAINGQLVKSLGNANGNVQIDLSDMAAGMYIVRMQNGKSVRTEKIQVVK